MSMKRWSSFVLAALMAFVLMAGGCGGGGSSGGGGNDGASLAVTPEILELIVGQVGELTAKNFTGALTWRSSSEDIAVVDSEGDGKAIVSAMSGGEVTIFVTDQSGVEASCEISVTGTLPGVFVVDEDHVFLQNAVYNPRIFQITDADVISASFKKDSDANHGIAPNAIVLSGRDFVEGDLLVAKPSEAWRYGFSAVVQSVEHNADGTRKYVLTQAGFGDILQSGQFFFSSYATPAEFIGTGEPADNSFSNLPRIARASPTWRELMTVWREERYPILEGRSFEFKIGTKMTGGLTQTVNLNLWKQRVQSEWSRGGTAEFDFGLEVALGYAFIFDKNSQGDVQALGILTAAHYTKEFSINLSGELARRVSLGRQSRFKGEKGGLVWIPFAGIPIPVYLSVGFDVKPYAETNMSISLQFNKKVSWAEGHGFLWEKGKNIRPMQAKGDPSEDTPVSVSETNVQLNGERAIGVELTTSAKLYGFDVFSLVPDLAVKFTGNIDIGTWGGEARGDFVLKVDLRADLLEALKKLGARLGLDDDLESTWDLLSISFNIFKIPSHELNGVVVNATDLSSVSGARVIFREAENGPVKGEALTDNEGKFKISTITSGRYFVEITAGGFSPLREARDINVDEEAPIRFTLVPNDGAAGRIVLTWGATPADLDSHLTGPRMDGSRFHVYFSQKTAPGDAALDVDDVTSFGPETITMHFLRPGTYRYSVHDYTNRAASSSSALRNSGATVLLEVNGMCYRYERPRGNGTLWTVFEIMVENNGNVRVQEVNRMSYIEAPETIRVSPLNKQTKEEWLWKGL